jgi:2-polyprenyl-3-methyl-5-hydroxy-6-metoxy-1,4-benzoquinol methylase
MRNILGDRAIEWAFVTEHLPAGPGRCLDFGPGGSQLATHAAGRGFEVLALDRDATDWHDQPGVTFVHADLFALDWPPGPFDVIINCSTIEHVGIPGRYGVTEARPDGDLDAMHILHAWMRPGGVMLLTIPLGHDALFAPLCRVYGAERLPRLLAGFEVEVERYYIKDEANQWTACPREAALDEAASVESWDPAGNLYALGCFVLRK